VTYLRAFGPSVLQDSNTWHHSSREPKLPDQFRICKHLTSHRHRRTSWNLRVWNGSRFEKVPRNPARCAEPRCLLVPGERCRVAIRVLGYMCQYNFEVKTNATRAFSVVAHPGPLPHCRDSIEVVPHPLCFRSSSSDVMVGCGMNIFGRFSGGIRERVLMPGHRPPRTTQSAAPCSDGSSGYSVAWMPPKTTNAPRSLAKGSTW
jgi:hypothetical protein